MPACLSITGLWGDIVPNRVKVTSSINLNLDRIYKSLDSDEFRIFIANDFARLAGKYVPRETGTLEETVNITPEYVDYMVPYAHYQWAGENLVSGGHLNYSKEKNPNATDHWDEVFMKMEGDKLMADIEKEAKRRLGGG